MRQRQLRLGAPLASISKEIKIDDTGPPALVLRGVLGGEIAAELSCSELVVRKRVSRGLSRLRERVKES